MTHDGRHDRAPCLGGGSLSDPALPSGALTALLVMAPGPGRSQAKRVLRGCGLAVRSAREPFEGTARFVEQPADVVVLSLERFRPRDVGFVSTVRRRAPSARILLLVPEGRRRTAVRALRAGADAYVLQPFYSIELQAVVLGLLRAQPAEAQQAADRAPLSRLANDVAHAINNPLQVLSLLGEERGQQGQELAEEVDRIRDVVGILGRFGDLREPHLARGLVGPLLKSALARRATDGEVEADGAAPVDGPVLPLDADLLRTAFDDLIGLLAARGTTRPVPVSARVRTVPGDGRQDLEAAVRGRGVHLTPEDCAGLRQTVVWSHEETRRPYAGLALADAVARGHRGQLLSETSEAGTVLAMRLPLS